MFWWDTYGEICVRFLDIPFIILLHNFFLKIVNFLLLKMAYFRVPIFCVFLSFFFEEKLWN